MNTNTASVLIVAVIFTSCTANSYFGSASRAECFKSAAGNASAIAACKEE